MKSTIAATLLGFGASTYAQIARTCPGSGNVCFGINIPDVTASSGNGDVYIQMSAPTSMQWVGLGQGDSMTGANMFIMYASADGTNVTVSPRLGVGEVAPQPNAGASISMLDGTGISNGMMVANFRCSSCNTWDGGSASFNTDSAAWIHAARSGEALNSNDVNLRIRQHNEAHLAFNWNYASGRGGNSVNPFASTSVTNPETTSQQGGDAGQVIASSASLPTNLLMAHGIMAALAFVVFFPIGSMIMRLLNFSGLIWVHAALQAVTYLLYTAALGIGIYLARRSNQLSEYHPIIGIVVFGLLFFQPFLGFLHHTGFVKSGGRTIWSHLHIWLGRTVITLGIINGGLGLLLANNWKMWAPIVYGVVAGVIWLAWMASAVVGEMRRGRAPQRYESSHGPGRNEIYTDGSDEQEKRSVP